MCKCSEAAMKAGYLHHMWAVDEDNGDGMYHKIYLITVLISLRKKQDVRVTHCFWCGEKLPISGPRTLRQLPVGLV